jgi:hypothetical protein
MSTPATSLPFAPKRKKLLTRPVFKLATDVPIYVYVEKAMYVGKDLDAKRAATDPNKPKKEPATILEVTNLATGEVGQLLVPAVVKGVFHDEYPNDSYVGKCFGITKQTRQPGKQYDPYNVEEIEDPRPSAPTNASGSEAKAGKK